jgi:hypothetical protein
MPDEGLSSSFYPPLVIIGIAYVLLRVVGQARSGERGETLVDYSFVLLLLAGAYTLMLALVALVSKTSLIGDLLLVLAVLIAFFGVLLIGLLAIFDLGIGGIARARARRRRGDVFELTDPEEK